MKSAVLTVTFVLFQILIHDLAAQIVPPSKPLICRPPEALGCSNGCFGTCESLGEPQIVCEPFCSDGCVCPRDTYRQGDECVPASKCIVPCSKNKHFDPCPKFKDVTCATLRGKQIKEDRCLPRCVCNPRYVLEESGNRCVKVSSCPK